MSKEIKTKSKTFKKRRNIKNVTKKNKTKDKKNKSITQHVNVNVSSTGGSGGGGSSMPAPMSQQYSPPLVLASKQGQKIGENVEIKNILESINKRLMPTIDYIPPVIPPLEEEDYYTPSDFFRKKDDSNLSLLNQVEQHNNESNIVDLAQRINQPDVLESSIDKNIDAYDEGTINMGGGGGVIPETIYNPRSGKRITFGGIAHAAAIRRGDIQLTEQDVENLRSMGLEFNGMKFKKLSNVI